MDTYDKESYRDKINNISKRENLFLRMKIISIAYVNCEWRTVPNLYNPLLYFYLLCKLIVSVIMYVIIGIPIQIFNVLVSLLEAVRESFSESERLEAVLWVVNSMLRLKPNNNYLKKYGKAYANAPESNGIVDNSTDGRISGRVRRS